MNLEFRIDPFPAKEAMRSLLFDAFKSDPVIVPDLSLSLGHIGAYDEEALVGFANLAWDGGQHAFLVDVCVASTLQGRGVGLMMVRHATDLARARGARWLHVDFRTEHEAFYAQCGFHHTQAGLIDLSD